MNRNIIIAVLFLLILATAGTRLYLDSTERYADSIEDMRNRIETMDNIEAKRDGRDLVLIDILSKEDVRIVSFRADDPEPDRSLGYAIFRADETGRYYIQTAYLRTQLGMNENKILIEYVVIGGVMYDIVLFHAPDIVTVERTVFGAEGQADETVTVDVPEGRSIVLIESPVRSEVSASYFLIDSRGNRYA